VSNRRKLGRGEQRPLIEPGWRPKEDGRGQERVYRGGLSGNAKRRFSRAWPMVRCRYCGAEPYTACVKRNDDQVLAETHSIRIDDAWDLVRGRATLAEVDARGPLATAAWPEARRA
jgi:hypothetical protein